LITAYQGRQREQWDHTCAMISSWTGKPCRNPYRKPERRSYMTPNELYALQKAIEQRNQT